MPVTVHIVPCYIPIRSQLKQPLINYEQALRESDGRWGQAVAQVMTVILIKRDNNATAPARPHPKGAADEPSAFVASP